MYLLDTDHITLLDRAGQEGQNIEARLAVAAPDEVFVSIVSYEEQMRGWLAALNALRGADKQMDGYRKLERLLHYYCTTPLLSFDEKALEQFQRLWTARVRIGTMDLKIAATALANDATLITRNSSDFSKVPGLRIEDWSV